jgi:nitrous oxidase accessory protein
VCSILKYFFILLLAAPHFAKSETIQVGSGNIKTIREAVDIAKDFDTIIINNGIYKETNIRITKTLCVIGNGFPVIDGDNKNEEILTVNSNNCEITGIAFKNTGISFMKDIACIRVENCEGIRIKKNIFENSFFVIYLSNSKNCLVDSNFISGNSTSESFSGNGIHLWYCKNICVSNNTISGQRDGIYLEFTTDSKIQNNISFGNLRYGLHFMFSEGNSYIKNVFKHNGAGVAVMYTKNIEMTDNYFENNWGANSYGLLLKEIDKSRISGNYFSKNTAGIYMEGSNNNVIANNTFTENGWAVRILGNCYEDSLRNNNFQNNTFDIATNTSLNQNYFESNYWDKYKGYDLNRDGTGDVPYRPVSLFSTIVEKSPESILLLRSFLVDLLDITEKVLPSFIPETLVDESPKMNVIRYDRN